MYTGSNFREFKALAGQPEYRTLGNIIDFLAVFQSYFRGEGYLIDLGNKFLPSSFFYDFQFSIMDLYVRFLCHKASNGP